MYHIFTSKEYYQRDRYCSSYIFVKALRKNYTVLYLKHSYDSYIIPKCLYLVKHINSTKKVIVEGELRCKELSSYLDNVNSPRAVWLSEDGSGIVPKVSYDSTTNQLVGLVLPFNSETGIPVPFTYKPKSVRDMEKFLNNPKSTHLYLIMAQPVNPNTPPYILQMFGTDNRFNSISVVCRWDHTIAELKK